MSGEHVGFEDVDDGSWIGFASVAIARFDERTRRLTAVSYARQ